jgi:hypothetical protein
MMYSGPAKRNVPNSFLLQFHCNYLQLIRGMCRGRGTAVRAIATNFKAGNDNVKATVALDLSLQTVEQIAFEFGDATAAQARHMDVITLRPTLVKMLFTFEMHEIQLVYETVAFQQAECAIHGYPVNIGVNFPGAPQDLRGVEMLSGSFHHSQNSAALASHTQAA